jgi:2-polyprenyl-3-methyl-5-hydroxy-6-metoxy-1,4-benzoquinol methylase
MNILIGWMRDICGCNYSIDYSTYNQSQLYPNEANLAWEQYQERQMPDRWCTSRLCMDRHIRSVLDVGAGTGLFAHFVKRIGVPVNCVEPCTENADKLSKSGFHTYASLYDVDAQYDLVHCNGVIEHVEDPVAFAANLFRHTSLGGVCWVMTHNELGLLILCTIFRLLTFKRFSVRHYVNPWHVNYWDQEHVERLLRKAGFLIAESWLEPWQQPPRRWSLRRIIHWLIRLHSICIVAKRPLTR